MKIKLLMKSILTLMLILFSQLAFTNEGGLQSLRGSLPLTETGLTPQTRPWKQNSGIVNRDYEAQPPVIPHEITGYKINLRSNKCLTCHRRETYKEMGATMISKTHFEDKKGNGHVSANRYFCTQCHVPQRDIPPLVKNTFTEFQE